MPDSPVAKPSIVFYHIRTDYAIPTATNADTLEHRRLIAAWQIRYGEGVPQIAEEDGLDREVWFERAARLFAALQMLPDVQDIACGQPIPAGALDVGNFVDTHVITPEHQRASEHWYRLDAMRAAARRDLVLCNAPDSEAEVPDANDVYATGARLASERNRTLMLKVVAQSKYAALQKIVIAQGTPAAQIPMLIDPDFRWSFVHLEGTPDAFLWSDYVPMRYEYRIFVVGGKPATGTGNIPQFDGAWASELTWDDRMIASLAQQDQIEQRPDLVPIYQIFAQTLATAALAENPAMRNYCLDVALGPDNQPLVVECNRLTRSGTFATNPKALISAVLAEAQETLHELC